MKKMPVLSIMISCPSDVKNERKIVEAVIDDINATFGFQSGMLIRTLYWEKNVFPQAGKSPQDIVNEQVIPRADAVIAIFGNKIGSPTEKYNSGTIEEIEIVKDAGKQVFVYFSDKRIKKDIIKIQNIKDIEKFKKKYANQGIYCNYTSNVDFKDVLKNHILNYVTKERENYKTNDNDEEILSGKIQQQPNKIYPNITKAHEDIVKDILEGKIAKFYGLRGATFVGSSEVNGIVRILNQSMDVDVKFLISYPYSEKIRDRLQSMDKYKREEACEEKWRQTYEKVIDLHEQYKKRKNAEIRFHDTVLLFRLIITKKHLYMGYYEPGIDSVDSCIMQFDNSTSTYRTYDNFFQHQWQVARRSVPKKIPAKYSFLKEQFSMAPSLVINSSSECNMKCLYCPTGGENLYNVRYDEQVSETYIKNLVRAFKSHMMQDRENAVLRITGGEPLLSERERKRVADILEVAIDYNKIVLCTNGVYLKKAYEDNKSQWDRVKNVLLLKISLDTLDEQRFKQITGTGEYTSNLFQNVCDNIIFAKKNGFKIELNMVATSINLQTAEDIVKVFDFARQNELVGLKVLTVNDFGERVQFGQSEDEKEHISNILNNTIEIMKIRNYEERHVYLNDNKGIQMRRFVARSQNDKECTLTIVDHNSDIGTITPRRTFSEFCKTCEFYPESESVKEKRKKPCATGMMSLTLRADGILSPCRLCPEKGSSIDKLTKTKIQKVVDDSLKAFDKCFHKTISGV